MGQYVEREQQVINHYKVFVRYRVASPVNRREVVAEEAERRMGRAQDVRPARRPRDIEDSTVWSQESVCSRWWPTDRQHYRLCCSICRMTMSDASSSTRQHNEQGDERGLDLGNLPPTRCGYASSTVSIQPDELGYCGSPAGFMLYVAT